MTKGDLIVFIETDDNIRVTRKTYVDANLVLLSKGQKLIGFVLGGITALVNKFDIKDIPLDAMCLMAAALSLEPSNYSCYAAAANLGAGSYVFDWQRR